MSKPEQPNQTEACLQALRAGIRGSQLMADALSEKLEVGQEPSTLEVAAKTFETARYWAEQSRRTGTHEAT